MDDDVRAALAGLKRELEAILRARGARGNTLGQMLDPTAGNHFPPSDTKRFSLINAACVRTAHSSLHVVREPGKLHDAVNVVMQRLREEEKAKLAPRVAVLRRFVRAARNSRRSPLARELAQLDVVDTEAMSAASSA